MNSFLPALLLLISTAAAAAPRFFDDFSSYARNTCFADGATLGPWTSAFNGFGCSSVRAEGAGFWLEESPAASTAVSETHAALMLGPSFSTPLTYTVDVRTLAQLRTNSPPNAWEVAWVIWHHADNTRFYYFTLKPNGWELGKADPAYGGSQRFLATGGSPVFPIGAVHTVKIVQKVNAISVYVDGALLTSYTDTERPYLAGRIGLYTEDATVRFTNVSVNGSARPAEADGRAARRFLSPAIRDGINDSAVFGASAEQVRIYDLGGRVIFRAERTGAGPIVWDGRDASGRVGESGVYVAQIRTADSGIQYQNILLLK